ncbi:hypothetical protein EVAR_12309_1 [Eumeta japonica]|uniref:Uncharacterized protein n=1 Tax=Eumeta variegata TaxID=151549 RepID=A0A4C1TUB1_EUMVA|nr:hypothetical protein EVAR_12309_1 [Eumeta japonica]
MEVCFTGYNTRALLLNAKVSGSMLIVEDLTSEFSTQGKPFTPRLRSTLSYPIRLFVTLVTTAAISSPSGTKPA